MIHLVRVCFHPWRRARSPLRSLAQTGRRPQNLGPPATAPRPEYPLKKIREALSGLIVIVAGVLLALAGEAAWAERGDRFREQELLADLLEEFQENEAILWADIEANRLAIDAGAKWSQAVLGEVSLPADSVHALLLTALSDSRFDPVTGALRSLVDGGELGVIRNTELRRALAGWVDRTGETRLTTQAWDGLRSNLLPLVLSYDRDASLTVQQRRAVLVLTSTFARQNAQLEALAPRIREIATMIQAEIEP